MREVLHTADCRLILEYSAPSNRLKSLTAFVAVSLSSVCDLSEQDILVHHSYTASDRKTIVLFSIQAESVLDCWALVNRIKGALDNPLSALFRVGHMKRVFRGSSMQVSEPTQIEIQSPKILSSMKVSNSPSLDLHGPTRLFPNLPASISVLPNRFSPQFGISTSPCPGSPLSLSSSTRPQFSIPASLLSRLDDLTNRINSRRSLN